MRFLPFLISPSALAADIPLERVKAESLRLRKLPTVEGSEVWKPERFHTLLLHWVESRLPAPDQPLPELLEELGKRDMASQGGQDFTAGLVTRIDFLRPNEDPNKLIVIVGVTHGCGSLDRAYIYEYDQRKPKRVMESRSRREHHEQILAFRLSPCSWVTPCSAAPVGTLSPTTCADFPKRSQFGRMSTASGWVGMTLNSASARTAWNLS